MVERRRNRKLETDLCFGEHTTAICVRIYHSIVSICFSYKINTVDMYGIIPDNVSSEYPERVKNTEIVEEDQRRVLAVLSFSVECETPTGSTLFGQQVGALSATLRLAQMDVSHLELVVASPYESSKSMGNKK
jgi:hypothetical protein